MKKIKTGQDARDALKRGIDLACDAIKVTLGPNGRNAVLGRIDIPPTITNDGVSVARNIEATDEIENQGVWIVKEACSVASGKAGDGTTTTAVLLQAIVGKLFDELKDNGSLVSKVPNVMDLMKQVDAACKEVLEYLEANSRPISEDEIKNVALVAGEFEWLANIVTDIFKKIGKDGHVTIEEGIKTSYETYKGVELNTGYHSEYYINTEDDECVLEKPLIYVTNQPLDNYISEAIAGLVTTEMTEEENRGIIIIAPDFSRDLLNRLVTTKVKGNVSIVALKLPTFDKDDILVDVATLAKAKFLDKNAYTKIEDYIADFNLASGGSVDSAIISKNKTILIGGEGDCTDRIASIRAKLEETLSLFDKDSLEKRIAYLSGGIATLTIGGDSDFERIYFKLKAENACNSVQKALRGGVVPGGGLALIGASNKLNNILTMCIREPYEQIQRNAGGSLDIPVTVLDPLLVTQSALKSACSLAARVLTTEVVTAFANKKEDGPQN